MVLLAKVMLSVDFITLVISLLLIIEFQMKKITLFIILLSLNLIAMEILSDGVDKE